MVMEFWHTLKIIEMLVCAKQCSNWCKRCLPPWQQLHTLFLKLVSYTSLTLNRTVQGANACELGVAKTELPFVLVGGDNSCLFCFCWGGVRCFLGANAAAFCLMYAAALRLGLGLGLRLRLR